MRCATGSMVAYVPSLNSSATLFNDIVNPSPRTGKSNNDAAGTNGYGIWDNAGTLNLNGGTLNAAEVVNGDPTGFSTNNFNGGTLKAVNATYGSTFLTGLACANVRNGGAIIDDGGNLMALERVSSVDDAVALAPTLGIPHQNLVIGDKQGHIAWTIAGRIPADSGATRATGTPSWTTTQTHPRIVDPEIGRIWNEPVEATTPAL